MSTAARIALSNVRIFDGQKICEPSTIIIDGGLIGNDATGARIVECNGAVLLPGLIDAHIHLHGVENLEQLRNFGITTALDMGTWPPALVDSLRAKEGLTDIRSAGIPATSAGSRHSHILGLPGAALVSNPVEAARFVADRVAEGSDYIKIIADVPGPDQQTVNALVVAAHQHKKLAIAHAASSVAYSMALEGQVDLITHAPLDKILDQPAVARMVEEGRITIPTLTMMESITLNLKIPGLDYAHARASVTVMYQSGIPILAGTDANASTGSPAKVLHGESLHHELELLVEAGLSTVDTLRAATSLPAKYFELNDRGIIKPGLRADLVLIGGDPVKDIRATRLIQKVWCGGIEYIPN